MIAASYESIDDLEKAKIQSNNTHAQIPAGHNAVASFRGHGDEEGGMEEAEDDERAPPPPEMIAASYEQSMEKSDLEKARNPPSSIDDDMEMGIENSLQDLVDLLHEVYDNDGTHHASIENPESRVDSPPSAPANVQSDPISIVTPTLQSVDVPSLSRSHRRDSDSEIAMPFTSESMPPFRPIYDRTNQSLPLLEATLVQDVPDVPVYDAFPLNDTQYQYNSQGWAKIPRKYRIIILGSILVATAAITAVVVQVLRDRRLNAASSLTITASPSESPTVSLAMISPTSPPPTATPSASPTTGFPTKAPLVWKRQGPAIVGDAADDYFGSSVAVSADARTIAIGAAPWYADDSKKGYIRVYRTSAASGNMMQLGQTIYGDAGDWSFGYSVDIAADGNTIIIGFPGDWEDNGPPGYVRIFSLESDDDLGTYTWNQIGQDLIGESNGDEFGCSVSISGDGSTIAVGVDAYDGNNGNNSGSVKIFKMDESQSEWIQIGDDIEGEAAGVFSGQSVSISADGNRVAISSDGNNFGHLKVYQVDSAGSWEQLGQTLYSDNEYDYNAWMSLDLSPDGNTLAIGSPGKKYHDGDRQGYVKVFSLKVGDSDLGTDTAWKQLGLDITGKAAEDELGNSVSFSYDGRTIAVGAWGNDGENGESSGHVRVYRMDDSQSNWIQIGEDIDGEAEYDSSGCSVALSADGNMVAIGSYRNDDIGEDAGHVRLFVLG